MNTCIIFILATEKNVSSVLCCIIIKNISKRFIKSVNKRTKLKNSDSLSIKNFRLFVCLFGVQLKGVDVLSITTAKKNEMKFVFIFLLHEFQVIERDILIFFLQFSIDRPMFFLVILHLCKARKQKIVSIHSSKSSRVMFSYVFVS